MRKRGPHAWPLALLTLVVLVALVAGTAGRLAGEAWHFKLPYHVRNAQPVTADEPVDPRYGVVPPETLVIESARFARELDSTVRLEPQITVTVQNLGRDPVLRVFLKCQLLYGGGRLVKMTDHFVVDIHEGLQGGQSMTWLIRGGMHRSWGQLEQAPDATLQVTIEKIYIPKHNTPHVQPHYKRR